MDNFKEAADSVFIIVAMSTFSKGDEVNIPYSLYYINAVTYKPMWDTSHN